MFDVHIFLQSDCTSDLEIRETLYLRSTEQCGIQLVQRPDGMQLLRGVHDVHELLQEPLVNLRQVMNLVDGVSGTHRLADDKYTVVGRFTQCLVDIGDHQLLVLHKTVHALPDHAESLLDGFFKRTTDGHDLTHGFHG